MKNGLLDSIKVIEIGGGISAPYCTKILGQMGAQILKIEPPEGDIARRVGPFPGNVFHLEKSALFLALNTNKFSIILDLTKHNDVTRLNRLVSKADLVVANLSQNEMEALGISYDDLKIVNRQLICTSITPFGCWGPYEGYEAPDLVLFHMSGHAQGLLGPVEDIDTTPPIRAGGYQAELVAGLAAATATLMALFQKRMTGFGRRVDISSYEALVTQLASGLANSAYGKPKLSRDLKEANKASVGAILGVLPCADGFVSISPREDVQWARWVKIIGTPDWATDERFSTREARENNRVALWELLSQWSRQRSKHEIARMGQDHRVPCFPVNTTADLFRDRHLASRDFFTEIVHSVVGPLKYPGVAYRLSNSPLPLNTRAAPLLGEHNNLVETELWA